MAAIIACCRVLHLDGYRRLLHPGGYWRLLAHLALEQHLGEALRKIFLLEQQRRRALVSGLHDPAHLREWARRGERGIFATCTP